MFFVSPLSDITNTHAKLAESPLSHRPCDFGLSPSPLASTPLAGTPLSTTKVHNPYAWKCLPDDDVQAAEIVRQRSFSRNPVSPLSFSAPSPTQQTEFFVEKEEAQTPSVGPVVCNALVQFKCHQSEFASPIVVEKGQYVAVQGDRGMDIGVIVRVNTDAQKSYVERTGPSGSILRHATQREVDYWATDLKAEEAIAAEHCRQRVGHLRLAMEVRHAEYQFDKKKLTFYYDAKARVDFVVLLKDLYKQFGCRIWMEKVRSHE